MSPNDRGWLSSEDGRPPTKQELNVILKLLDTPFPGREELQNQLNFVTVQSIDRDGSLKFFNGGGARSEVVRRIPVEAETNDIDGVVIHVLLHVADGFLDELEIYREDSAGVRSHIDPEQLRLLVL
jgi:hypothetical protein